MSDANTSNVFATTLTTNFNVTPYYDDYDIQNNYYRILFKPGYAVQARELTQIQSMIQNQITQFGKHVFKEGSIVYPGSTVLRANEGDKKGNPIDYVKINDTDISNNTINIDLFKGATVKGSTSNVHAYVIDVVDTDGTSSNNKTLYVTYLSTSDLDSSIRTFLPGETLTSNSGTMIVKSTDPVANTGYGSWFSIEAGVFFAKNHFIYFPYQEVILDRYNPNPTCKVGFIVSENIVKYTSDTKLLDPALEASNYAAPGADRLQLVSDLTVVPYDYQDNSDFIPLFTIKDGVIQTNNEASNYNILGDSLAARTFDESGDYVVKGLNIQVSEHDAITSPVPNYGKYANGNNQLLVVSVDAGSAYVKGYAIQNYDRQDLQIVKPQDYRNVSTQYSTTTMGQSIRVNEVVGTWQLDQGKRINFYDRVQRRISNNKWSISAQTGNNIGSAFCHSIQYVSGTPGYDAIYDVYLSDVRMTGANNFSNVRSVYYDHTSVADIGADIYGANNSTSNTTLQDISKSSLLYYVGSDYIKSVRDSAGSGATTYNFSKTDGISSSITIGTGGTFTLPLSGPANEILPYGTTTLSDTDVLQDIMLTTTQSFNIGPLSGTISASGNTVTGAGTHFTYFNVGDKIEISGQTSTWYISGITDNTHMTLSNTVPASVTSNSIFKAYKVGDIIPLNGKGVTAGADRTVSATPTALSIDIKETLDATVSATLTYKLAITNTSEGTKTLKPDRVVKISCATAGTTGPFCLGFTDVYKIKSIVLKNGSAPTSSSDGTDVTSFFTLDNGQRDTLYDLASIRKSSNLTLTGTSYLLVTLDYFEPTFTGKAGYFSVNSYPVEDNDALSSNNTIRTENIPVYVSPVSSLSYDLRNFLDFRPIKSKTATDTSVVASASTNPSNTSSTYTFSATGMHFPVPSSELIFDYSYYIGRRDIVVINKEGVISVISGTPSANPQTPVPLDTQMLLGVVKIPPYPSLAPAYGNVLGRKDLSCSSSKASNRVYTMRDIGILDQRIKTLEEYTSLTLLEKDALNLKILDASGNDRFKNGIFVDTFKDTSLSAKGVDKDFRIVTDPVELCIRPLFSTESVGYDYISGSGVKVHDDKVVTLNYTEVEQYSQARVTDVRTLERATFSFNGQMTLFPEQDVWVDVSFAPDEIVTISAEDALLDIGITGPDVINETASIKKSLINTEWENWKSIITGYNVYKGDGNNKTLVGFYTTEQAARAVAASWTTKRNDSTATLETVYNTSRIGTNYFSNTSGDSAVGSAKVLSTNVIPYIRPQRITVNVAGLKPNSLMRAFFDSTSVSDYCTPLTYDQYVKTLAGTPVFDLAEEGSDLVVDTYGNLYFSFRIPSDSPKFRTGERKLIVIDGLQLLDGDISTADVSTSATGYFYASGTQETLQRTVYSTKGHLNTIDVGGAYESKTTTTSQVLPNTWVPPGTKGYKIVNNRAVAYHSHCCFDPYAKVLMKDLSWKMIKDIVVGDEVIGNNGTVNKVLENKKIGVGTRKMLQIKGASFWTTDDHLFLTKKGWKTWRPDVVLASPDTTNGKLLVGDNRTNGIDITDEVKYVQYLDGTYHENFIPLEVYESTFDPDYQVHDLTLDGNMSYIVEGFVVHNCCIAYSVMIRAPSDEEGIFVTSFDIFVGRKSATRGLWFEIREVDNAGNITTTSYPGSKVVIDNADITNSTNGRDNPLNVKFTSPLFLFNNKEYAFVVHSQSPNQYSVDPDTQIWVSRLGEVDVNTKAKITERQGAGNFFQTSDNINWDRVQDLDLTININRASFSNGDYSFVIGSKPLEKLHLANQTSTFASHVGDYFVSGDTLTLSGANGTIYSGNTLYGNISTTTANSRVISSLGSFKYLLANTGYRVGEKVDVYNGGVYAGVSATVTNVANSYGKLAYVDESRSDVVIAELTESTGGFVPGMIITCSTDRSVSANVATVNDYRYSALSFEPKSLNFTKTSMNYTTTTYPKDSTVKSSAEEIFAGETYFFTEEKSLYSRTNEVTNISSNPSNEIGVNMSSISTYVSPVIDLDTSHTIFIDNILNANTSGEDGHSGGQAYNKYISQTITLADGQEAEDIKVYLTSYRPPSSDVKVYVKVLHADDPDPLSLKDWVELEKDENGDSTYSSISDKYNYVEYTYSFPSTVLTGSLQEVQYTSNGILYTGYKYFAVKIVLTSTNSAMFPKVADLRVLAIQK